jgi:plastocyanin
MRLAVPRRHCDWCGRLGLAVGILAAPGALVMAQSDALAASTTITAYSSGPCVNCWQPANVTVNIGDQVTWAQGNGPHGLQQLQTGSVWPAACPGLGKYGSCSFSQAGTFNFQCSVHGPNMAGSITVSSPPPPSPPPPPPTNQPAPPVAHSAPAAQSAPPVTQAAPTPSQAAPSPSPSPSETAQALASPAATAGTTGGVYGANTTPASSGKGLGLLPFIIGLAALLAAAGGVVYFVRTRNPANPAP